MDGRKQDDADCHGASSDRVCMMNGPEARVGRMLSLSFARPRDRAAVLEVPSDYDLRGELYEFLEKEETLTVR